MGGGRPGCWGLYGMVDSSAGRDPLDLAAELLEAGAPVLQLRMKGEPDEAVRRVGASVRRLCSGRASLVINDRVAVARALGVGVHLGQEDGDPAAARAQLGDGVLIGWSTHGPADLAAAAALPLDYVGFGPVFSADGKHRSAGDARAPMAARGLDGLAEAVRLSRNRVVAIGGIGLQDVPSVVAAGADAVATIRAVSGAADVVAAGRSVLAAFAENRP